MGDTGIKISDLQETVDLRDRYSIPIVADDETFKVTYGFLKNQLKKDLNIRELPIAKVDSLGVVMIGDGLSINERGVLSTESSNSTIGVGNYTQKYKGLTSYELGVATYEEV